MFDRLLQMLTFGRSRRRKRGAPRNFKRKRQSSASKNPHEHVLEVVPPISRKMARQIRLNRLKTTAKFAVWTGAGAALLLGAKSVLAKHFWNSPNFTASRAELHTNGRLTREEILQAAGLEASTHMFAVDLRSVQERLLARPDIREATVERLLPGGLEIRIVEREPIAWISCESPPLRPFTANPQLGGLFIDEEGVLFPCPELRMEWMKLPVIHVRRLTNSQPGLRVSDTPVLGSLELLQRLNRHFGARGLDVVEIDSQKDWSLIVKLSDDSVVTFGYEDMEGQLSRLAHIMEVSAARNLRLATVNLLPRKNVPVTFRGTPPPESFPKRPTAEAAPAPPPVRRSAAALEQILGGGR